MGSSFIILFYIILHNSFFGYTLYKDRQRQLQNHKGNEPWLTASFTLFSLDLIQAKEMPLSLVQSETVKLFQNNYLNF